MKKSQCTNLTKRWKTHFSKREMKLDQPQLAVRLQNLEIRPM